MHTPAPDTLPDPLLEAAAPFGAAYLFPYQRLVISNVLEAADALSPGPPGAEAPGPADPAPGHRRSVATAGPPEDRIRRQIVVLPTGAGKTLCFQLPAAILRGLTVVVYPLLSLMADQIRRAEGAGLTAVVLRGGQSREERTAVWDAVESGRLQLLLTNPEMLSQESVITRLAHSAVSHLVIDEAHCVSEWGETFRPAYLELGRVIRELEPAATTAFTATASPVVLDAIRTHLFGDGGAHLIQSVPDRPNIAYSVLETPAKLYALTRLLAGTGGRPHGGINCSDSCA